MVERITTFKEALEAFERLEQDFELPDWTINDVYVWKLMRFQIFSEFRIRLGLTAPAHPEAVRLQKNTAELTIDFAKLFVVQNPFIKAHRPSKRVVIPHYRKRLYAGRKVDPISYPAWQPPYHNESTILDTTTPLYPTPLVGTPSYKVLIGLGRLQSKIIRLRLERGDLARIKEIEWQLALLNNNKLYNIKRRVLHKVREFLGLKAVFKCFFKYTQPTHLYVVVSYGKEALIAAAQELGIHTVEFQHGSLGRGHVGYDFKDWSYVPYFPERMLAFGKKWFSNAYFPEQCAVDPIGYMALECTIRCAQNRTERNPKQLLVLSQGSNAAQLIKVAAEFTSERPDWKIIVRPHPSERERSIRTQMQSFTNQSNWMVDKSQPLAEQAAASSVALGVSSTALIEALLTGCRVAVLDTLSSANYFEQLVRETDATKIRDGEGLAKVIDCIPLGNARGYFVEPVSDIVTHVEDPKGASL